MIEEPSDHTSSLNRNSSGMAGLTASGTEISAGARAGVGVSAKGGTGGGARGGIRAALDAC